MGHDVGIIGLGVLGSAIAKNIVAGGRSVLGFDRAESARGVAAADGVVLAESSAEVARDCPLVLTCLPNAAAVLDVAREIASVTNDGQIVIELSTMSIADKEAARTILEGAGRHVLDCPVSGNRIMALAKGLTAFCSGTREHFELVRETLLTFCKKVHYVGPFGNGTKTKLCGNILNLVHNTVAAEAMVLAIKSGLDPKMFWEVISGSGSSSAMFEVRGRLMAENNYAVGGYELFHSAEGLTHHLRACRIARGSDPALPHGLAVLSRCRCSGHGAPGRCRRVPGDGKARQLRAPDMNRKIELRCWF